MNKPRKFITFDWAMKKILRSKTNFDVLEGFLSELLKQDITIESVLESESDRETRTNKLTRVDLMVRDSSQQQVIIEVQYEREADYFQRMLLGTSKAIAENLDSGAPYSKILKVISVNIVFFDLGQGDDYVYVGHNCFCGMHTKSELELSASQKEAFSVNNVSDIFPTYYLLKVNQFNDVAKNGLDEWLYFLKNEEIKSDFRAKGLKAAKEKLDILKLNESERRAFDYYQQELHLNASVVEHSIKALERKIEELETAIELKNTALHREEEARNREEEARNREEEARNREEEAYFPKDELANVALAALMATGFSDAEAKDKLGMC